MAVPGRLTLRAVRDWAGDHEVGKGRPYAEDGAVTNTVRQGDTLKANVRGSRDKPYRAWAEVRDGEVVAADCSCPVGDGGRCKHVAALLLAYLADPDQFQEVQDLDASLRGRDKAELIALIKQMVRRAPDLESLLAVPLPGGKRAAPPDPDAYRRQATEVIRGANPDDDWAGEEIAEGLDAVIRLGEDFEHAGDVAGAAAVYRGVAAALSEEGIDYLEGYGPDPLGRLADGLLRCLDQTPAGLPREPILRALFEVLALYGDLGVNGDGGDRLDALLATVTPEERRTLAGWLKQGGRGAERDYRGRMFADLLRRVDADVMDDEAELAHYRQYGMRPELVAKLLALGRPAEAVGVVRTAAADPEVLGLADQLVAAGLAADAEAIVGESASARRGDPSTLRWLRDRAVARKDDAEALRLTRKLFELWPSTTEYDTIRGLTPAAAWPKARAALLADLDRRKAYWLLVDILLAEGEVGDAIKVVKKHPHTGRAEAVARAAETDHPAEAEAIYRALADEQIAHRSREQYRQACVYLGRAAELAARVGRPAEFQQYLHGLVDRHRTLRAFQEEVRAAKLLADVPPTAVQRGK